MINDIYEAAKERGLVRSLRHFSTEFLHRAPNYPADTRFERCSVGALLNLYRRLGEIGQVDLQACAFERLLAAEDQSVGSALVRP